MLGEEDEGLQRESEITGSNPQAIGAAALNVSIAATMALQAGSLPSHWMADLGEGKPEGPPTTSLFYLLQSSHS